MARTLGDVLPLEILPEVDRDEVATHMSVRKFKQGEVIYHQGDPATCAFVVFEGLVKILLLDENGHELLVSLHMRGEFFGELAFFQESAPRDGTAAAVIPTAVLQIARDGALAVLRRNEEARRFMFERLSRTIRHLEGKAEDLAGAANNEAKLTPEIELGRSRDPDRKDRRTGPQREVTHAAGKRRERGLGTRDLTLGEDHDDLVPAQRVDRRRECDAIRARCLPVDRDDEPDRVDEDAVPPDAECSVPVRDQPDRRVKGERRREQEAVCPALMVRDDEERAAPGQLAVDPHPEKRAEDRAHEEPRESRPEHHRREASRSADEPRIRRGTPRS